MLPACHDALQQAHRGQRAWRESSFGDRAAYLQAAARILRGQKDRWASLATLEMGKPIVEAEAEIDKCAWACDFFAEHAGTFLADELPRHTDDRAGVTRAEIDDALRLREILEVGAARMAANRTLTAAEREVLWSRLADVRGAAPDDYRRLDSRLHLAIAEAAGSPSLVPLVAENRMRLNALLDQIPLLPRNIAHSDEQHEAIVVAILAADGEGAAAAMRAHVAGSAALLHGFLD